MITWHLKVLQIVKFRIGSSANMIRPMTRIKATDAHDETVLKIVQNA